MKSQLTFWICLLLLAFSGAVSAQDKMKIKDTNGNVLLETREDGVIIRKMTTAERVAVPGLDQDDNGLMVYDTETKSLWLWHDTAWVEIDGVDLVNDADHDPANELQSWTTLPGIPAEFADGIDDVNDADSDPTNEKETWSTLPGIPSDFADGIDNINDADSDPTNEKETWSTLPGIPADFADGVDNVEDGDWFTENGKTYNTSSSIGIGTDDPKAGLHVKGNKDSTDHIMLIENENPDGNGLKIKINGNHPLWVELTDTSGFFVPTLGVPAALSNFFEPTTAAIKAYLINGTPLSFSSFNFDDLFAPGSILDDMGLEGFATAGVCKGASTLVDVVNGIGLQSITLPDLPVESLPANLPDIPNNFPLLSFPNLNWNPPDPCLSVGSFDFCVPLNFTLPLAALNDDPPITTFNSAINGINSGIGTVNTAIENGYDGLRGGLEAIDGIEIPIPQFTLPATIGPLTCPNPNPLDAIDFSFSGWNEEFGFVDPLSKKNEFITFVDKGNRKLGAVTAKGFGNFAQDYFTKEKVLEIGGHIIGLFSMDGGLPSSGMKLAKDVFEFIKASNKIGVAYESGFGDYAEWLERADHTEEIGFGDIVGIKGGKISLSLDGAEQIMVVSKAPIVRGNAPEEGNEMNGNDVAFIGQVPVKVMGPVSSGDFIVADLSTPGYGIAVPEKEITTAQLALAVGKSWETNLTPGFKYVNAIVGMHNNGWAVPVRQLQQRLDTQEATLQSLAARLDHLENEGSLVSEDKKLR